MSEFIGGHEFTCPVCGEKSSSYYVNQGTKWGRAYCPECDCMGPEVRTGYDLKPNAEWHEDAVQDWLDVMEEAKK